MTFSKKILKMNWKLSLQKIKVSYKKIKKNMKLIKYYI